MFIDVESNAGVNFFFLVISKCLAWNQKHNSFYDHYDMIDTDYNMFDTFEGYTWHRFQHIPPEHK